MRRQPLAVKAARCLATTARRTGAGPTRRPARPGAGAGAGSAADPHFREALRTLRKLLPEPGPKARSRLNHPTASDLGTLPPPPVPAIGSGGVLDGRQMSMRQRKLQKHVEVVVEGLLSQSSGGWTVDVSEVSVSRDGKQVIVWWNNDGSRAETQAAPSSAWIRRPELSAEDKRTADWLARCEPKLRVALAKRMRLNVAPRIRFQYDSASLAREQLNGLLDRAVENTPGRVGHGADGMAELADGGREQYSRDSGHERRRGI